MSSFSDLDLLEPLQRALAAEGYAAPTPIQAAAIPPLLAGHDLLGIARTGTGKTAAFALPLLQRLAAARRPPQPRSARVLVLTPTRELALQIHESFGRYGCHLRLARAVIFGGVGQGPQVKALARGVDVLVATPGRLIDLIEQGHLSLAAVEAFVLDEADRMLDMGFIHAVRRIVALLPAKRQTLLFSATMPDAVAGLAARLLSDPVRVEVTPAATTAERVEQRVLFVEKANKRGLLLELLRDRAVARALIFTRTKHGANRVAEQLVKAGVRADAIHGNKSQNARQRALEGFRSGHLRALVATDIAARGIDIDGITHVINFDLPNEPESYVHRIGRTARAGAEGIALSFCDAEERAYLRDIEKVIRQAVPVDAAHPFHAAHIAEAGRRREARAPQRGRAARAAG
jgi:ATP-dependent RNA helicase RhlE